MPKIKQIERPEGKPVKLGGWTAMKKRIKKAGAGTTQQIKDAFGDTKPKDATALEMADVLKRFLP